MGLSAPMGDGEDETDAAPELRCGKCAELACRSGRPALTCLAIVLAVAFKAVRPLPRVVHVK
jgi:hypothetical protein